MDENRIAGTAKNIGGKAQETFGRVTGDASTQAEGIVNQVSGAAQDLYGQARDSAADAANTARDTASSFEKVLRNTIENQPYTAVAIGIGLGWLLGRMHRPL
ncbi:MAG: CsbD family protein [Xanthobacteraceae bacterium]